MRVIVVGSGLGGLLAATEAAEGGADVLLVTKARLADANTTRAQGGIAAALFADDSVEAHIADTLAAGAGLCDPAAVEVLCAEGPARVRELIARGVRFDRVDADATVGLALARAGGDASAESRLARGLEAAHSVPRVLHAGGDATGAEIERALIAQVAASPRIAVLEHTALAELVLDDTGAVVGVELSDTRIGDAVRSRIARNRTSEAGAELRSLHQDSARTIESADAVVLATGGAGQLFSHTTNPTVATGDGIAAAWRAGAELADAELHQFHPTALAAPGSFLISEAVRGEGAVLRNARGERFMRDVHPDAELAPRDVVARGIATEMSAQGGAAVYLDATGLGASVLARRFPTIDAATRAAGFDWSRDPIPVTPAAHYWMGGIATDAKGRTSLPGLWAVGECASTGVHGANRLASNSLLEAAVFARRAALDVVAGAAGPAGAGSRYALRATRPAEGREGREGREARPTHGAQAAAQRFSRSALQTLMWEHVGVQRSGEGLELAASVLDTWTAADPEDRNLLDLARVVVDFALAREESRGAHYRTDFPLTRPEFAQRRVHAREGASVC